MDDWLNGFPLLQPETSGWSAGLQLLPHSHSSHSLAGLPYPAPASGYIHHVGVGRVGRGGGHSSGGNPDPDTGALIGAGSSDSHCVVLRKYTMLIEGLLLR
jgi:hypothetical protein